MSDEAVAPPPPIHVRVRHGLRHPGNWLELVRFGAVGASGYVVNLVTFAAVGPGVRFGGVDIGGGGLDYRVAAVLAFLVGVLNNFWWNRHWTFGAADGHAGFQAARFLTVSVGAFAVSFGILHVLVEAAGLSEISAQAIAIVAATPLNFLGNKLWSFRG